MKLFGNKYWLGVITGIVIGFVISRLRQPQGVIRIDRTDPEKDVYRFDVGDLDMLAKKHVIYLRVDNNANLSQK